MYKSSFNVASKPCQFLSHSDGSLILAVQPCTLPAAWNALSTLPITVSTEIPLGQSRGTHASSLIPTAKDKALALVSHLN